MLLKQAALNDSVALHPHQQGAVDFISTNRKGVVAHGTGLGKTLTSIAAFEKLRASGGAKRALVIVPASLRDNYASNIRKYTNSSYSIYGPKNDKGSSQLGDASNSDYNIISYEMYKKDPAGLRERLGADTLIIDEAHRARNEASDINKELSNEVMRYGNVLTLTGSVVNNHPSDISPLMDATFGREGNPIGSRADFNRKYTTKLRKGGWGKSRNDTVTIIKNRGKLSKAIGDKIHYVSHQDMGSSLPPASLEVVQTPMTKEQKKLYMYAYRDLPPILQAKIRKNVPVSQKEMAGIFARIMQARKVMTDPAAMDARYEGLNPYEYSPKVRRVVDDLSAHLSESRENKAVIYGNLIDSQLGSVQESLDAKRIPYATYFGTGNEGNTPLQRKQNLEQYMSGKKRVLLISGAGGEGLDLKGSSMLQMLEGHYNPEKIHQAEARVRRMGDRPDKPILIKRYVSTLPNSGFDKFLSVFGKKHPTSIDEYIYTVADRKDRLNQDFRSVLSKDAEYSPPRKDIPGYLKKDPVHSWRADTGIELIHKEPTLEELQRIRGNWRSMDRERRKLSDQKSKEIFGVGNKRHYKDLVREYDKAPIAKLVEPPAEMPKVAVDIKTLSKIYRNTPIYKHPLTRAATFLGLGRFLHPGRTNLLSGGGASALAVGRTRGIHLAGNPIKAIEAKTGLVAPRKARGAIIGLAKAHEGIEFNIGSSMVPKYLQGTSIPGIDVTSRESAKAFAKNVWQPFSRAVGKTVNSAKSLVSGGTKSLSAGVKNILRPPLPAATVPVAYRPHVLFRSPAIRPSQMKLLAAHGPLRREMLPGQKATSTVAAAPQLHAKVEKVVDILAPKSFGSHMHPDVLMQEGNILATLTGKNSAAAANYVRSMRNWSNEAPFINAVAKDIGINNYHWGVTRISRHGRKNISNRILDLYHGDPDVLKGFKAKYDLK